MSGTQRQLHVDAAELSRQVAVLVLGIDDEDLDALAQRAHGQGRQQIGLARSRVSEDTDIGVGVKPLVKRIDEDRSARGSVAADEQAPRLLQVGLAPGKEGDQRGRVEDPFALQAVGAALLGGQEAVEHAKGAGLKVAQDCARGRLDTVRSELEVLGRWCRQPDVGRDVEGLVLARGKPPLQVFGVR